MPFVAEFLDDSGLGNAIAVDAEGVPYTSYFGSSRPMLAEGEIPVGRPLGSPYITTDDRAEGRRRDRRGEPVRRGRVDQGAAAQVRETPTGVYIPYGPAFDRSLVGADAENTNGTDIAIDDSGAEARRRGPARDGISYAGGADGVLGRAGLRLRLRPAQGRADRPAVGAADADGNPWVAYTVNAEGQEVRVATGRGSKWRTDVVATIAQCAGCPQPQPDPHRRDVGRPDRRVGRHRRRRGDGLDAAGR